MHDEDGGLNPEVALGLLYAGYCACRETIGGEIVEWDDLPDEHREGWLAAYNAGSSVLDAAEDGEAKWGDVAKEMFNALMQATTDADVRFESLQEHLRVLWEALARHLANLLLHDSEDDGAAEAHVDMIGEWYASKADGILAREAA